MFYNIFRIGNDDDAQADYDDWMDSLRELEEEEARAVLEASYDELFEDQDAEISPPIIDAVYDPYVTPVEYQFERVAFVNGKEIPLSEIERYASLGYDVDVWGV